MASGDRGVWDWMAVVSPANWIAAGSLALSAGTALWAARKDIWSHSDARRAGTASEQRQAQQDISAERQKILEWHENEIAELRKKLAAAEVMRAAWEARARWWYEAAHDLLGKFRETRHLLGAYAQNLAMAVVQYHFPDPGLDGPSEERPVLPARIEDIKDAL